jgi:tetratricopeptide (TPR) repeat protein
VAVQQAVAQAEEKDSTARAFLTSIRSREVERQRMLAEKHAARIAGGAAAAADDDDEDTREEESTFLLQTQKADELKQQGNECFRAGDMKGAAKCYTAAIALNANDATYYSNRAAAHLGLGNGVQAAQDARMALELKPLWGKAHYRLGCAMSLLGRWDSAVLCFERALELDPEEDAATIEALSNARAESAKATAESQSKTRRSDAGEGAPGGRRPWFDCPLCENRTRDKVSAVCCQKPLCGTCWTRRKGNVCPFCASPQ